MTIDDFVAACRAFAAEALGISETRVSASGFEAEEGIVIDYLVDGEVPTDEQTARISSYIDKILNEQMN